MIIFDVILLIILAGFVFYGLFFGLIKTLGSLVGVIAGAFVASHFYLTAFNFSENLFFGYNNLGKVISFIVLFTLVNRLVCLIFSILDKTFHFISIIPFLKTINRLAGAIFGFIEGCLVLGLILYVVARYSFIESLFGGWISNSEMAPFLVKFANVLLPLLPEMLKRLKSLV